MSRLRVSWVELHAAAAQVGVAVSRLGSELDVLNTKVNALVGAWESDAKQAYVDRQQKWNSAGQNIDTALNSLKQALIKAADHAHATELANKALVQ